MSVLRMSEMSVMDVKKYLETNQTIVFPYGIVEQHGYHLPLSTDIHNAEMLSDIIAEGLGCMVAPTLNYCFSGGMLPGTINVKPNHFSAFVVDIIESLTVQGFRNIIIVPGHGGSESLENLRESLRIAKWMNPQLRETTVLLISFEDYSPLAHKAVFEDHDFHSGNLETSMMLAYRPDLVHMENLTMDPPDVAERLRQDPDSYQDRTYKTSLKEEIPSTKQHADVQVGVMGHPELATAGFGQAVLDEFRNNIIPVLKKELGI